MLRAAISLATILGLALSVACSGPEETGIDSFPTVTDETETNSPTPSHEVILLGSVDYDLRLGDSLSTFTVGYDMVAIRITGIVLPFDPRSGYGGVPPITSAPGDPKDFHPTEEEINRSPGRLFTAYSGEILDPGGTALKVGQVINIIQSGGIWEEKVYQDRGNPLLQVGGDYLLPISATDTVSELPGAYLVGVPFATFVIEGDAIAPLDPEWSFMPAVQELTGNTPEEALAAVIAAREQPASPTAQP